MGPDVLGGGYLNFLLSTFVGALSAGYGQLKPYAIGVLGSLTALELIFLGIYYALGKEDLWKEFLPKILLIGFIFLCINQMPVILSVAIRSATAIGGKVAPPTAQLPSLANPSQIVEYGLGPACNFFAIADDYHWWQIANWLVIDIAGLFVFLAYLFMALQALMAIIELYLIAILSLIVLPFGTLRYTTWITQSCFKIFMGQFVKLVTLAVILAVVAQISENLLKWSLDPKMAESRSCLGILGISIIIAYITYSIPRLASGFVSGSPSLSASGAIGMGAALAFGTAKGVAGTASGIYHAGKGAIAVGKGAIAAGKGVVKASQAIKGAIKNRMNKSSDLEVTKW